MDFTENVVLKEHYSFLVADEEGQVDGGERGLYNRDTRLLSRYAWSWHCAGRALTPLVVATPRPDTMHAHHALIEGPSQLLAVSRTLRIESANVRDELTVANTALEPLGLELDLRLAADFRDLFEVRGWPGGKREPASVDLADGVSFAYTASDGVRQETRVAFGPDGPVVTPGRGSALLEPARDGPTLAIEADGVRAHWSLELAPGEERVINVAVSIDNPLDRPPSDPVSYRDWRQSFAGLLGLSSAHGAHRQALERAVDDLRGLLLFTPEGPVPAAGIPWFVAAFGRDALLSAYFLLPFRPDVAAGTLGYLARWQADAVDERRAAQPGRIMHELRFGEFTRTGLTPHSPYYGSIDATPLFLMLLGAYVDATGDRGLLHELKPAWEAALTWLVEHGDLDGDGLLEFATGQAGKTGQLSVQSWKDSHDSMSHASGALASGPLAVSEVQGYAYAAFLAAAGWYRELGDAPRAAAWQRRATTLFAAFDQHFWLEELQTYAMALDGEKRPLAVRNSDAGHLLWCGLVPAERSRGLVDSLFSARSWSGWGLRTLGSGEARYNPVSYHNGSVWPHDTALFALGLVRYGYSVEAARVRAAIFDLAACQPDQRLPELVGGYERDDRPPVPYPVACRPQAWDAAALLHLASLEL